VNFFYRDSAEYNLSVGCVQIHSDRASDESQVLVYDEQYLQDGCWRLGGFVATFRTNSSHYGIMLTYLTAAVMRPFGLVAETTLKTILKTLATV